MSVKASPVEFDRVVSVVSFDTKKKCVSVNKEHYVDGKMIRTESHLFDLCTMQLSVIMQLVGAIVQQIDLIKYEE